MEWHCIGICDATYAQNITGPTSVTEGQAATYTFNNGTLYPGYMWTASTYGSISNQTSNGASYSCTVTWTAPGTANLTFMDANRTVRGTLSVTITVGTPSATISSTVQNCSSTTITRASSTTLTNAPNLRWYWQSSSTGTSTSNSTTSYSVNSTQNAYLRAQDVPSGVWSAASQNLGSVSVLTPLAAPATATNGDAISNTSVNVPVSVSSVTNATGYAWYTVNTGGTPISGQSTISYSPSVSATTSYWVASVQTTSNGSCTGTARKQVTANVYPVPVLTASNNGVVSLGAVTLSVSNFTYDTYAWYNGATLVSSGTSSISVTTPGSYTVKVTKGVSSLVVSNAVTVQDVYSQNYNFIVTNTIMADNITSESAIAGLPIESNNQQIEYFDGLGRSQQKVVTQGSAITSTSPNKLDVIEPIAYDQFGRQTTKYLPYVSSESTGWYKSNPLGTSAADYPTSPQYTFYNNGTSDKIVDDANPYAVTIVEPSPLHRMMEQGGFGTVWKPDNTDSYSSTDHTRKYAYEANIAADNVLRWTYTYPYGNYTLGLVDATYQGAPVYYPANKLFKIKTKDEQSSEEIIEFKDIDGRIILRQVNTGSEWAQTYYIYDDFGYLVCVIPPEGVKAILKTPTSDYFNQSTDAQNLFLSRWAFRYVYDGRGRAVRKQTPGAAPLYIVHDDRDRVVMTQDGKQRGSEWNFVKYDQLNRAVLTGRYLNTDSLQVAQATVDTYYSNVGSSTAWNETYIGSGTGNVLGYDDRSFPQVSNANEYYTALYFDQYDSYIAPSGYAYLNESLSGQPTTNSIQVTALPTGGQTKILGTTTWLRNVAYYDDKHRPIQTMGDQQKGTIRVTTVFDFPGRVQIAKRTYVVNSVSTTVKETYTYDHMSRLLVTKSSIQGAADVITSSNSYNILGQLIEKNLHSTDNGSTFKQSVDFRYNIRGWLTKINESDVSTIASGDATYDYFGMELAYDNTLSGTASTSQYNGNISAVQWSIGAGPSVKREAYAYGYDAMNRMLTSSYTNYKNSAWTSDNGSYIENATYDLNGNIRRLMRTTSNGGLMDSLHYYYGTGNRLAAVTDAGDIAAGFVNGTTGTSTLDYKFDVNGNMILDNNKGITSISYNYLNLPTQVNKGTDYVVYTYDATGKKLTQQVFGSQPKTTDYIGTLVYENNVLKFIQHSDGRILPDGSGWEYQYFIKDHLGNVRVTFTSKTQTTTTYSATFETAAQTSEAQNFSFYPSGAYINTLPANAHTGNNSEYLSGGVNGQVGVARSFNVLPGDQLQIQAYAKFNTATNTTSNLANFASALLSAFQLSAPGVGETGTPASAINYFGGLEAGGYGDGSSDNTDPRAFVTILLFDKNYNFLDVAYQQTTTSGGFISASYTVRQQGYAYVYISNENAKLVDVYFDDVAINYTPSQILSVNDYYPYGLQFNNVERSTSVEQRYLYNSKELQDELSLDWYDYGARMYMPEIGRWGVIDPLTDDSRRWSPYAYADDNPIRNIDPDGRTTVSVDGSVTFVGGADIDGDGNVSGSTKGTVKGTVSVTVSCPTCKGGTFTRVMSVANGKSRTVSTSQQTPRYTGGGSQGQSGGSNAAAGVHGGNLPNSGNNNNSDGNQVDFHADLSSNSKIEILKSVANGYYYLDHFVETTKHEHTIEQTAVIIVYNTNPKDMWGPKYGVMTEKIVRTRVRAIKPDGTLGAWKESAPELSGEMKQLIEGARNYHCGNCLINPSIKLLKDYGDFIMQRNDEPTLIDKLFKTKPRKNRLNNGAPHR